MPDTFELRIPALPRYAKPAREAFAHFGAVHQLGSNDLEPLTIALGEALANAIQNARCEEIDLVFQASQSAIVVTVADQGRGFLDPPRGPVELPTGLAENGRGFGIMQQCTDFFGVESKPGHGTVVTLGRYLRDQEPDDRS